MKSKKSSLTFMVVTVGVIIGLLAMLAIITKYEEKKITSNLPTSEEYENSFKGEVTDFEYESQPVIGEKTAPVKVVEFGDFKCPSCAAWKKLVFPQLYSDYIYTGKVQFYFVNWQFLDVDSILAGVAGEAIYHQNNDAFWEFYSKLYENQGTESKKWATEEFLLKFVKENVQGIDYKKFEKELKERKYMDLVYKDLLIGKKYGVKGTPSIYVNGKKVETNSFEAVHDAIEVELGKEK